MYRNLFVETVIFSHQKRRELFEFSIILRISDTNRYRVVLVFSALYMLHVLFYFMYLLPRHPNMKSQYSVVEQLHTFWQFSPYNGKGQVMKHPRPLYPGLHSEKKHSPITCSIYFIFTIQLPCLLTLKHFITIYKN